MKLSNLTRRNLAIAVILVLFVALRLMLEVAAHRRITFERLVEWAVIAGIAVASALGVSKYYRK